MENMTAPVSRTRQKQAADTGVLLYIQKGTGMISQNTCGAVMKQIRDELEKNANNALRPQGLTMAQVSTLLAVKE